MPFTTAGQHFHQVSANVGTLWTWQLCQRRRRYTAENNSAQSRGLKVCNRAHWMYSLSLKVEQYVSVYQIRENKIKNVNHVKAEIIKFVPTPLAAPYACSFISIYAITCSQIHPLYAQNIILVKYVAWTRCWVLFCTSVRPLSATRLSIISLFRAYVWWPGHQGGRRPEEWQQF